MGNKQEGDQNNSDWLCLEKQANFTLVRHRLSSHISQKYTHPEYDSMKIQKYQALVQFRKRMPEHVVGIYGWEGIKSEGLCSQQMMINIYSQNIKLRLEQLVNLPQDKGIQIFRDAVRGFIDILYNFNILTQIRSSMIGFNQEEQVKVWINQDFGSFYPSRQVQGVPMQQSQHRIINQMFTAIQYHIQNRSFSERFLKFVSSKMSQPFTKKKLQSTIKAWFNQNRQRSQPIPRQEQIKFDTNALSFNPHPHHYQASYYHTPLLVTQKKNFDYQPPSIKTKTAKEVIGQQNIKPNSLMKPDVISGFMRKQSVQEYGGQRFIVRHQVNVPPQFKEHFDNYMRTIQLN